MTTITRRKRAAPESNVVAYLINDKTPKPYCTCRQIGGYVFDVQIGVYLHSAPTCWKPSKGYWEAAVRAGILTSKVRSHDDPPAAG